MLQDVWHTCVPLLSIGYVVERYLGGGSDLIRVYIPVMWLISLGSMFEILWHCLLLCMWNVENEEDAGM